VAEQRAEHALDLVPLAADDDLDVVEQRLGDALGRGELGARIDVLRDDVVLQYQPPLRRETSVESA
jgi:hypothetical protein